jgi:hypothetical protein
VTIATPLALRWERARQMDRSTIKRVGDGLFRVPSHHQPDDYDVKLSFDPDGNLAAASCTCPDFNKSSLRHTPPMLHGLRVCKHVLAAALRAQELKSNTSAHIEPDALCAPAAMPLQGLVAAPQPFEAGAAPNPFPVVGEPTWDAICMEWVMTDSDGIRYYGSTPNECHRQFCEALHYLAKNAHMSGFTVTELREFRALDRDWSDQLIDERPY